MREKAVHERACSFEIPYSDFVDFFWSLFLRQALIRDIAARVAADDGRGTCGKTGKR